MKAPVYAIAIALLLGGAAGSAQSAALTIEQLASIREYAMSMCPPVQTDLRDQEATYKANVDVSLSALFKHLANLKGGADGSGASKTSQGVLREKLDQVIATTLQCRVDVLKTMVTALLGAAPPDLATDVRVVPHGGGKTAKHKTAGIAESAYFIHVVSRPEPAAETPVIVRVFLKNNLTTYDVVALANQLPNYDVRLGKSTIDPKNAADTLFVNRDRVSPEEILPVLQVLARLGVPIKSVQQEKLGGRREIQVGTVVGEQNEEQVFQTASALDLSRLATLHGVDFWREALNGHAFCTTQLSVGYLCGTDADARPVANPAPK